MSLTSRLGRLDSLLADLDARERTLFVNSCVGALARMVSDDEWNDALAAAIRQHNDRSDEAERSAFWPDA